MSILVGIGLSLCSSTLSTWFAASMPEDRIAQGMGIYGVIQAISMAIAPAFGLWVASVFGYRIACWTAALFNGVCIPLILPLHDEHYIAKADTSSPARQRKRSFLLPQLIPLASIMFLFCVPYNGAVSFLDVFVKSNGLSFSAGIFFSSFAIWLLLTRLFLSRFLDRISFRVFVIIGIPLAVFSMLLLQWTQSIYCLIVSALLLSLSYGILQPVGQATSIKSAPEGKQGVANCTYYIGMDLGMALGPVIAGGVYQVAGASLLFYTMAFFPLLAIPILIIFKKYLVKDNNRNAMENRSISNI